jgi:hypothetical protein
MTHDVPIRTRCSGLCTVHCRDRHERADTGWDPVPYLARLIDGVARVGRSGGDPRDLASLLAGPYAALRGGLLLDEPGHEHELTGEAIRKAILAEVRWAPYQEFGIPDPAAETGDPPPHPVVIRATGFRGYNVILYWSSGEPGTHDPDRGPEPGR